MHLRSVGPTKETVEGTLGSTDRVLAVSMEFLRNEAYRRAFKNALYAIENDGISQIVSLPDYVKRLVPQGPYITHFRRTQTYQPQLSKTPVDPSVSSSTPYLNGQKVCWSYFERWTNPNSVHTYATAHITALPPKPT